MNCKFENLKLALKIYINVPKWEEEDTLVEEEEKKGGEVYHTFIEIKYILGKDLKRVKELFRKFQLTRYKSQAILLVLMKKRKYRKKIKIRVLKRRKKRYPKRIQRGKGIFSDGFNILKSLGKTYYHALGGK